MNERLTIQDLTDLLAAKHSMTKKDAEVFVKEFFLLIFKTYLKLLFVCVFFLLFLFTFNIQA